MQTRLFIGIFLLLLVACKRQHPQPSVITLAGIDFARSTSADLSDHTLALPASGCQTLEGFGSRSGAFVTNCRAPFELRKVPCVAFSGYRGERDTLYLAKATNGWIYELGRKENNPIGVGRYIIHEAPVVYFPARLIEGTTWTGLSDELDDYWRFDRSPFDYSALVNVPKRVLGADWTTRSGQTGCIAVEARFPNHTDTAFYLPGAGLVEIRFADSNGSWGGYGR